MAPAPKTSSEPQASASDDVVCRSVADAEAKRAPLITLEGGRTIAYVRCECSKCQGLVMCGDKQLLPTAVTPSHYDLALTPDLETFQYDGVVTVKLTVREPCAAVTFHAKDLKISSGVVVDASGAERTNPGGPDILYGDEKQETATVALSKPLLASDVGSEITLTLAFSGELNDKACSIHWFPYDRVGVVNADP
jgi:hypothetical protein